jgi:hypothetical protein
VDGLYRHWTGSKAELISAPESKPFGLHEFMAKAICFEFFMISEPVTAPTLQIDLSHKCGPV